MGGTMVTSQERLPGYLRAYCSFQDYEAYTPRDHAAWRYIMRQNLAYFERAAVPVYREGLAVTGISTERIPRISEMDEALSKIGWGAVPVVGFIPPAAFLDFQARGILPIAVGMRFVEHIGYTPAPDIVHEAAGHAPILADPAYRDYLRRYATLAQRAIMSNHDLAIYEAIRTLSDLKEDPSATQEAIAAAHDRLARCVAESTHVSEATELARMAWWTTEYGLVGSMKDPKVYGAGLLSSVDESQACLDPSVRKIPLTVDCIKVSYDITQPQPQLFIVPRLEDLAEILGQLEKRMAYHRGGVLGLERARAAQSVCSVRWDSGLVVSGVVDSVDLGTEDWPDFVRWKGPVQLCGAVGQHSGQGVERHPDGFSSPLGFWQAFPERLPSTLTEEELRSVGVASGRRTSLRFQSGAEVSGVVEGLVFEKSSEGSGTSGRSLQIVTWRDCTVTWRGRIVYRPEWGPFDMAVGVRIHSVWGGPGDRHTYPAWSMGTATTQPGGSHGSRVNAQSQLMSAYRRARMLREDLARRPSVGATPGLEDVGKLAAEVAREYPREWLLLLELVEIVRGSKVGQSPPTWYTSLESRLRSGDFAGDERRAIDRGLALAS